MTTKTLFLPLVVPLALFAWAPASAGAVPSCVALGVTGDGALLFADGFETGGIGSWAGAPAGPIFHGTDTLEVRFELTLGGELSGEHTVELQAIMPGGFRYQTLTVPFGAAPAATTPGTAPRAATTPRRRVEGYPDPLPMQTLRVAGEGAVDPQVTGSLPVGGTSITTGSLYGAWTVEAYLDGADVACATASFEIRR
jgi:hypothetical protein